MRDAAAKGLRRIAALTIAASVGGCGLVTAPILDPKGPIALAERDLLFTAMAIMLIVIIPVFIFAFWFVWRYRASNTNARYEPEWFSPKIDAIVWIVPALIIITLGVLVWINTHKLDPYRPLASSQPALEVEVIA
ncbi:MAG: cytochrome ubiquinol oxidase subunit II, partial [Pseudomonadota bacterium]